VISALTGVQPNSGPKDFCQLLGFSYKFASNSSCRIFLRPEIILIIIYKLESMILMDFTMD
jgi:hypothetical protein